MPKQTTINPSLQRLAVPIYCEVILQRWENLTGKKAEKV